MARVVVFFFFQSGGASVWSGLLVVGRLCLAPPSSSSSSLFAFEHTVPHTRIIRKRRKKNKKWCPTPGVGREGVALHGNVEGGGGGYIMFLPLTSLHFKEEPREGVRINGAITVLLSPHIYRTTEKRNGLFFNRTGHTATRVTPVGWVGTTPPSFRGEMYSVRRSCIAIPLSGLFEMGRVPTYLLATVQTVEVAFFRVSDTRGGKKTYANPYCLSYAHERGRENYDRLPPPGASEEKKERSNYYASYSPPPLEKFPDQQLIVIGQRRRRRRSRIKENLYI